MAIEKGDVYTNPLYAYITNSSEWAKDSTLNELVNRSDLSNTILSEYVKKVAPELAKKISDAENKIGEKILTSIDEQTDAVREGNRTRERDELEFQREVDKLNYDLSRRLDTVSGILKSSDPSILITNIGNVLERGASASGEAIGKRLTGSKFGASLGGIIAGTIAGALTASLVRTFEISKSFKELYDTGVSFNGSMADMVRAARDSGQTVEGMTAQLTKFSDVTVAMGTNRMVNFGKNMLDITRKGAEYGMGVDQLREATYDYLQLQTSSGQLGSRTQAELSKGASDYLQNLTELSAITGKTRKQEADALKAKMMEAKTKAAVQLLSKEDQDLLTKRLSQTPAELQDYVRATFVEMKLGIPALTSDMRKMTQIAYDPTLVENFRNSLIDASSAPEDFFAATSQMTTNMNTNAAVIASLGTSPAIQAPILGAFDAANSYQALAQRVAQIQQESGVNMGEAYKIAMAELKPKVEEGTQAVIQAQGDLEMSLNTVKSAADLLATELNTTILTKLQDFGNGVTDVLAKLGVSTGGMGSTSVGAAAIGGTAATAYLGYKGVQAVRGLTAVPEVATEGAELAGKAATKSGIISRLLGLGGTEVAGGAGLIGRVGAGLAKGGVLSIVGTGLDIGGDALKSAGYETTGGLTSTAGAAATGAGIGAMVGSVVPVVGTAIGAGVGAAAGGAYGLYENWNSLFGGGEEASASITDQLGVNQQQLDTLNSLRDTGDSVNYFATQLNSLTSTTSNLTTFGDSLTRFADAYGKSVQMFNSNLISSESIDSINQLTDALTNASQPGMLDRAANMLGIGGGATDEADDLSVTLTTRTMEHYDYSKKSYDNMVQLLQNINDQLTELHGATTNQTDELSRSLNRNSWLKP